MRLYDGSISKSPSWGSLWMVNGDSPLPIQGIQGASISSRMLSTLVLNSLSLTLGGMPEISRPSPLDYCSFICKTFSLDLDKSI